MKDYITVIGGGLAGTEAAYQIANRGIKVKLYEMKPVKFSPAHSNNNLAEIVCSNSFKSNLHTNACGLLKEELRLLDSLLIKTADKVAVPAGQALAVDREKFAEEITKKIEDLDNVEIIREEVGKDKGNNSLKELSKDSIVIIATGPLTSDSLSEEIKEITGNEGFHFYDAAAPIIEKESIDMNIAFWGDRYDQERGKSEDIDEWKNRIKDNNKDSYINLPMNKEEYELFWNELVKAELVELHEFEKREIFEGCMPIEIMAKRGIDTLRFGPLKPVGFTDPRTGKRPYAIVQLRQDNSAGNLFNMVGFQTNLKYGEQKRVFRLIPGLENADFTKLGVMHRNSFINSPELLDETYNLKKNNNIFFAGQITGVEGYVESIASGLVASLNAIKRYIGEEKIIFPEETMIGALAKYIATENKNFQPMNANFGIVPGLDEKIKDKKIKYGKLADRALEKIKNILQ
jgi:methylenetetrahydrofolate--tRNA-(uracil-5-)-methyltransferase